MANLNLGQDVANTGCENKHSCSYCGQQKAVLMLRYGSLVNINPSGYFAPLKYIWSVLVHR